MNASRWVADGVGQRRRVAGFVLAVLLLPVMTVILTAVRARLSFADDLLIYLLAVLAVTCVGGVWPAVVTAASTSGVSRARVRMDLLVGVGIGRAKHPDPRSTRAMPLDKSWCPPANS